MIYCFECFFYILTPIQISGKEKVLFNILINYNNLINLYRQI